jgi:hypothetical protein
MRVIPTADGICPSCRKTIPTAFSQPALASPFADPRPETQDVIVSANADPNPYASPALLENKSAKWNPLLAPAVILLVGSLLWFLMVVWVAGIQFFARGHLARLPQAEAVGEVFGFFFMALLAVATIAGAISMINRQSKQNAWAGAIVALIPVCGPCYGLLIPFAIWAIIVLCRSDVRASFRS